MGRHVITRSRRKFSGKPAAALVIFQRRIHAIDTSDGVRAKLEGWKESFPPESITGHLDTTVFAREIYHCGRDTLFEAVLLVA